MQRPCRKRALQCNDYPRANLGRWEEGVAEVGIRLSYHRDMNWSARFQSHPQFEQATRFATGRPPWVLKATGMVAILVFAIPLAVLVVLMIVAVCITSLAWIVFSTIARMVDACAGQGPPHDPASGASRPKHDGRENVRVIQRP